LLTGAGAVFKNRAHVYRGDSVAVIGVGGIGISCIQAARIAGATKIIAVDALASKESMALQFGATHFVDARATDATAAVVQYDRRRGQLLVRVRRRAGHDDRGDRQCSAPAARR
jgi:S-(hydroxymethyl)glutathione dehydrogenase/alcohol dehydrogenase